MSSIIQLEENLDKCIELLMEKLKGYAAVGGTVDIAQWVQWYVAKLRFVLETPLTYLQTRYAFDVIGELFFSRMFGFMEHAHDHAGYINALDELIPIIAVACVMPSYLRLPVMICSAIIPRVFKALKALDHIGTAAGDSVHERQHELATNKFNDREDMLQSFFDIMHKKGSEKDFGLTEVKMEVYGGL
jgi:hypothetical protein